MESERTGQSQPSDQNNMRQKLAELTKVMQTLQESIQSMSSSLGAPGGEASNESRAEPQGGEEEKAQSATPEESRPAEAESSSEAEAEPEGEEHVEGEGEEEGKAKAGSGGEEEEEQGEGEEGEEHHEDEQEEQQAKAGGGGEEEGEHREGEEGEEHDEGGQEEQQAKAGGGEEEKEHPEGEEEEERHEEPETPKPVALFDGTEGAARRWEKVGSGTAQYRDGELLFVEGTDRGLAYYKGQQFDDFLLRLEFRCDTPDVPMNVAVRFLNPEKPVPDREKPDTKYPYDNQAYVAAHTGFEIRMGGGPDMLGTIAGIELGGGQDAQRHTESAELNTEDWNELEVEVRGNDYVVHVNGIETASYTNTDSWRGKPASEEGGYIGLLLGKERRGEQEKSSEDEHGARRMPRKIAAPLVPSRGGGRRAVPRGKQVHIRRIEVQVLEAQTAEDEEDEKPSKEDKKAQKQVAKAQKQEAKAERKEEKQEAKDQKKEEKQEAKDQKKEAKDQKQLEKEKEKDKKLTPQDRAALHAESVATRARLESKYPALKKELERVYGYAIFPSVGRAGVLVGGSRGYGEVYERGEPIGFSRVTQLTLGVHVGGQTFSELVLFGKEPALRAFKGSPIEFDANASIAFIRGASGTTDFKDIIARAYSRGGMLLEASLGGQKFRFYPKEERERTSAQERKLAKDEAKGESEESDPKAEEPPAPPGSRSSPPRPRGEVSSAAREMGRATKGLFSAFASKFRHRGGNASEVEE